MYIRTTRRRNADGSEVAHVAIAHNHCEGSKTRTEVLLNLGRAEAVDTDGLRRLVSSIARHLGDPDPYAGHAQPGDQPVIGRARRQLAGWQQITGRGLGRVIRQIGAGPHERIHVASLMSRPPAVLQDQPTRNRDVTTASLDPL
jgi:hypothetical protein